MKRIFPVRQTAAPKVELEFLFTSPKGVRQAFELSTESMKEDRELLEFALCISAVCGRRAERLRESLLSFQKQSDRLLNGRGYDVSFDGLFAEVLAFHFFAVMQDHWKKEDSLDDLDDNENEYYEVEEQVREETKFHEAMKYARLIADVYLASFSCVPLPDEFLKRRISTYSDLGRQKGNVFEEFAVHVMDRVSPSHSNELSLDVGVLSQVCVAFILDCDLAKFVATCKDMYRQESFSS